MGQFCLSSLGFLGVLGRELTRPFDALQFHLPCVGLKSIPDGRWYCPDCRVSLPVPLGGRYHADVLHDHQQRSKAGKKRRQ